MKIKISIAIFGLCLIIAAQVLVNTYLLTSYQAAFTSSYWVLIYILYIKIIKTKYLKW